MEFTTWYSISIAALVAAVFIYRFFLILAAFTRDFGALFLQKHLFYPIFWRRRRGSGSITRFQALLISIYLAVNGVCMIAGVSGFTQMQSRIGIMSVVNLIPLLFGGRTNVILDYLGVSLQDYYLMHHWVGRVGVAQGVAHSVMAVYSGAVKNFDMFGVSGIIAATALVLLLTSSFFFVRRKIYETFLKVHFGLGFMAILALLVHLRCRDLESAVYPTISLLVWTFNFLLRAVRIIYRSRGRVSIKEFLDPSNNEVTAIQAKVRIRNSWRFRAGQYVYACLPGEESENKKEKTIFFIIQPRKGFTRRLLQRQRAFSALIDGPYGKLPKTTEEYIGSFETVLMFAAGIGIIGQLSYIRCLIEGFNSCTVRTRRVSLVWMLEKESHESWVKDWLRMLSEMDKKHILSAHLYIPSQWLSDTTRWGDKKPLLESEPLENEPRKPELLLKLYQTPNIEALINSEASAEGGQTMITVCVPPVFSKAVRDTFIANERQNMQFMELEFRPDTTHTSNNDSFRGVP